MTKEQYDSLQFGDVVYSGKFPACVLGKEDGYITTGPWPQVKEVSMFSELNKKRPAIIKMSEKDALSALSISCAKEEVNEDMRQRNINHLRVNKCCLNCINSTPIVGRPWWLWCGKLNYEVSANMICDIHE